MFDLNQATFAAKVVEAYCDVMDMGIVGLTEDKTMMTVNEVVITHLDDNTYRIETKAPLLDRHRGEAAATKFSDAVGLAVVMAIEADMVRCINQRSDDEQLH